MKTTVIMNVMVCLWFGVAGCGSGEDASGGTQGTSEQKKNLAIAATAVERNIFPFMGCYETAREQDESLKGKIVFRTTVQTSGKATDISLPINELGKPVGECFKRVLAKMEFPAVTAPTLYEESLCFDPDGSYCKK